LKGKKIMQECISQITNRRMCDYQLHANAHGLDNPVILFLSTQSTQAQAVYQALSGKPMNTRSDDTSEDVGEIKILNVPDACDVLYDHGSKGGAFAAEVILDKRELGGGYPLANSWLVALRADGITISCYGDRSMSWRVHAEYDRITPWMKTRTQFEKEEGPCMFRVCLDDKQKVDIIATTGRKALMAAALIRLSARRGALPGVKKNYWRKCAVVLLGSAMNDAPDAIATALKGLRTMKGNHDKWLTNILKRPELSDLHNRVQQELEKVMSSNSYLGEE